MRSSDWSSDVCSSDLTASRGGGCSNSTSMIEKWRTSQLHRKRLTRPSKEVGSAPYYCGVNIASRVRLLLASSHAICIRHDPTAAADAPALASSRTQPSNRHLAIDRKRVV